MRASLLIIYYICRSVNFKAAREKILNAHRAQHGRKNIVFCALPRIYAATNAAKEKGIHKKFYAPRRSAAHIQSDFYKPRFSVPKKKGATVPGPVCEPITVPMGLISTLPFKEGNASSIIDFRRAASASIIEWLI